MSTESLEAIAYASASFRRRITSPHNHSPDRLPPHDATAESAIIGCCLLDAACISKCEERILDCEAFYDLRHQTAYRDIQFMHALKEKVDVITLGARLGPKLAEIGGYEFLNACEDQPHSTANLDNYLDIVCEKYVLRKIIAAASAIVGRVYDHSGNLDNLIGDFESSVLNLQSGQQPKDIVDGKRAANDLADDMERRFELKGRLSGLDTGLVDLNYKLDGFQPLEQVVVGARPSMGKTALGLGFFLTAALQHQVPSLFISLEMTSQAIMRRAASSYCSIPLNNIKKGNIANGDMPRLLSFNGKYSKSPAFIVDGVSGMTMREIAGLLRRMVLKHGIKFVVIDYLQKIRPDIKHEKRTYEVGDVSGKLKALAVETEVAMVTLAQLNREHVQQKGRSPRISDLADSGQIERDADSVLLIHREEKGSSLIVAKQRDGETGFVPVYFNGPFVRFENCATESNKHWNSDD